jgi:hypothetical protein
MIKGRFGAGIEAVRILRHRQEMSMKPANGLAWIHHFVSGGLD